LFPTRIDLRALSDQLTDRLDIPAVRCQHQRTHPITRQSLEVGTALCEVLDDLGVSDRGDDHQCADIGWSNANRGMGLEEQLERRPLVEDPLKRLRDDGWAPPSG
jgi:hypothetical protein